MTEIPEFTTRPELAGTFGMVASTHWLASAAGMAVLERGGNAFDAAVAAGFTLQVVEPHLNGPGGEVPVIGHDARRGETFVVCGQGTAPAARDRRGVHGPRPRPGARQRAARRHRARRVRRLAAAAARVRHAPAARRARLRDRLRRGRLPAGPRDQLVDRQRRRPVPRALAHLGGGLPARRRRPRAGHAGSPTARSPPPTSACSPRRRRRAPTATRSSRPPAAPGTTASSPRRSASSPPPT